MEEIANSTSDWPRCFGRYTPFLRSGTLASTFKQSGKHSVGRNVEKGVFVREKSKESVIARSSAAWAAL